MTRDEITSMAERYTPAIEPPKRLNFDEEAAYKRCIFDIQTKVVSCPSVLNYMAYQVLTKASQLRETIDKAASTYIRYITKGERGTASEAEVAAQLGALRGLIQQQASLVGLSHVMYNETHSWLLAYAYSLKHSKKAEYTDSNHKEALGILIDSLPKSISGVSITLNDAINMSAVGDMVSLTYKNVSIPTSPLIVKGSVIGGYTVKSSKDTGILTGAPVGPLSTVTMPAYTIALPVVTDYSSHKNTVTQIVNSNIQLDRDNPEVKTCLAVFKLPGANQDRASLPSVYFDPTTKSAYRAIKNICYMWKQPSLLDTMFKYGVNYVCKGGRVSSPYSDLKRAVNSTGLLTNTRGALR